MDERISSSIVSQRSFHHVGEQVFDSFPFPAGSHHREHFGPPLQQLGQPRTADCRLPPGVEEDTSQNIHVHIDEDEKNNGMNLA